MLGGDVIFLSDLDLSGRLNGVDVPRLLLSALKLTDTSLPAMQFSQLEVSLLVLVCGCRLAVCAATGAAKAAGEHSWLLGGWSKWIGAERSLYLMKTARGMDRLDEIVFRTLTI